MIPSNPFLSLSFLNLIPKSFPLDPNPSNTPRQVPGFLYSKVLPTPLKSPEIISLSPSALTLLDLPSKEVLLSEKTLLAECLSGGKLHPDSEPIAHNYSGYQFGQFAGQLGDGRAITLGNIRNKNGELLELQLKGSGMTPYSRFADGRAVLRSCIREFLCSEAMFHLGIPTTRALSIVGGEDKVIRDILYNGNPKLEQCAVVLRISPSFIRFGSFEFMLREKTRNNEKLMNSLFDFLITNHYPSLIKPSDSRESMIFSFYEAIVKKTASLVALWQCYGFCHGVLNTDNMSIIGVTIDYGPFGFLDYFNQEHICNHSDKEGRYSFENQPEVCKWNLMKLAEALGPLADKEKMIEILNGVYDKEYERCYYGKMKEKLGLLEGDKELIDGFIRLLDRTKLDFTNAFRRLAEFEENNGNEGYLKRFAGFLMELSPSDEIFGEFYKSIITEKQLIEVKKIYEIQPKVIEMLGYNKEMIEKIEKQINKANFYKSLKNEERNKLFIEEWEKWLFIYKTKLLKEKAENRKKLMNLANPAFVLRNYLLENCIRKAEKGDYRDIEVLLELSREPFELKEEKKEYYEKATVGETKICVSCSS